MRRLTAAAGIPAASEPTANQADPDGLTALESDLALGDGLSR